mmetsp:Transcript_17433/g.48147  ORF Transcript_17433/g.48147 Transcript_17433/m.48147 type:complete len:238 (+) Transcript_17433:375-1088(+)|eukprot:CAMPEP_0172362328 /NCGR_PEP_ID=MMETSP1060-20121228/5958_1 /TAXON_ID=37318 /ORGANISM="Pseudo-nitzschia pungens, Strain cf. cingulata" /LENGTH=237 /DNA_ID=CAMNT_0013084811 /DNA_START=307 /DNA_END=1020 /DNA_ORIENTATION=-
MIDPAEQESSPSLSPAKTNQLQAQPTGKMSIFQMFTSAVSDCLDEEMGQLNKDFEEGAFLFSGLRNLIAAEFREDAGTGNRSRGSGDERQVGAATTRGRSNTNDTSCMDDDVMDDNMEYNQDGSASVAERTEGDDDQRSDFLFARMNDELYAAPVPDWVVFKPKKRRGQRDVHEYPELEPMDANFFFTCNNKCRRNKRKRRRSKSRDSNRRSKRIQIIPRWKKRMQFLPSLFAKTNE